MKSVEYKKVLVCERKRHTARHEASARYAALSPNWGGGRLPHPVLEGDTHSVMEGGAPEMGYPPPRPGLDWGSPPIQTWDGGTYPPTYHPDPVVPPPLPVQTWDGIPLLQSWDGGPPPPPQV